MSRQTRRSSEELLELVKSTDTAELMQGKDSDGTPYLQHIFRLHLELFGQTCTGCVDRIPGYIQRIKNHNPMKNQSKKTDAAFALKKGVIIPVRGTSKVISEHNLTDETAIALLKENPNRKSLFRVLPKNVDELIAADAPAKPAAKASAKAPAKAPAKKAVPAKVEPAAPVVEEAPAVEETPVNDAEAAATDVVAEQVKP
jgi:hypothetical protein